MFKSFVVFLWLCACSHVYSESFFSASNAWFVPELEVNKDEEVCSLFLGEVNDFHLSSREGNFIHYPYKAPDYKGAIGKKLNRREFKLNEKGFSKYGSTFTFRGKEYYLINDFYHRGAYVVQDSFLITSEEYESIQGSYDSMRSLLRDPLFVKVPLFTPFSFRKYKNNFYTFSEKNGLYLIYKLSDSKSWVQTCSVRYIPKSSSSVNDELENFRSLIHVIGHIRGESQNPCWEGAPASLSNCFHRKLLDELIYRPWRFLAEDRKESHRWITEKNEGFFSRWGFSGLWNYKVYKELKKVQPLVKKELEKFYMTQFEMPSDKAAYIADYGVDYALGGHLFSGYYPNTKKNLYRAILQGRPILEVEALLDEYSITEYDYLLSFSIGYPELLKLLLERGASPNTSNYFGKTPLMYAAQFNELESAKLLMEYGANPNATTEVTKSYHSLVTSNVTPLHYAVRYASKEFIEYLLDMGAATYIKTRRSYRGQPEYPLDWLLKYSSHTSNERNSNILESEIDALKQKLRVPGLEKQLSLSNSLTLQAEELYQEGHVEHAYRALHDALNLTPNNERTLSNMSLIALRNGAFWDSLAASLTLKRISKNPSYIANAWFNEGLACEGLIGNGENVFNLSVNGNYPCRFSLLKPFFNSFVAKPNHARKEKIKSLFEGGKIDLCRLYSKSNDPFELHILRKLVYVYHSNSVEFDPSDFSWEIDRIYRSSDSSSYSFQPEFLSEHILGGSRITIFSIKAGADEKALGCE